MRFGNTRQPFETLPDKVQDPAARESHDRLRQFFDGLLMSRFEGDHFEIDIPRNAAETEYRYPHNFRFIPKDAWFTSQINENTGDYVIFDYAKFSNTDLVFDISGITAGYSVKVRFFAGVFVDKV